MKSINKILLSTLAIFACCLLSCEDDITRDPSPEANPSSNKVYFPEQESNLVLPIDASSIEVTIAREVINTGVTVNLHLSGSSELFNIPKSISFEAGEAEKTFKITLGNLKLMQTYFFSIETALDQTDPYDLETKIPVISFKILKEDFVPYAKGIYSSAWWEEEWDADLEYSPATEQYRIKEFCGYEGYDAYFEWEDKESKVTMVGGKKLGTRIGFQTGDVDPTYGMVWAVYDGPDGHEGPFEYDHETKTFTFGYAWRVSAGLFGVTPDNFTIESLY